MTPATFPQQNTTFGTPQDMAESQVHPLPGYIGHVHGQSCDGAVIAIVAWKPTESELAKLNAGGCVFLSCLGGLPPHFLCTSFEEARNPA